MKFRSESFELSDVLYVDFGYIPNNSCKKEKKKHNMNKQTIFFCGGGGAFPPISTISTCSPFKMKIFSTIFYNSLNICLVQTVPWNLNILYIIYHLIHFVTQFLYSFCMQSMKNLAGLLDEHFYYQKIVQSLFKIKRFYQIFAYKYHT